MPFQTTKGKINYFQQTCMKRHDKDSSSDRGSMGSGRLLNQHMRAGTPKAGDGEEAVAAAGHGSNVSKYNTL